MKISKLFHWLYSILMLMPIFAIGVSCLYVIFNKNAKDSYSGENIYEINYKYQSNEVNSVNDLVEGNIYNFNITNETLHSFVNYDSDYYDIRFLFISVDNFNFENYTLYIDEIINGEYFYNMPLVITIDSNYAMYIQSPSSDNSTYIISLASDDTFDTKKFTLTGIVKLLEFNNIDLYNTSFLSYTDYNEIESVNIDNSGTLDNVFYYSIDQLKNNSLFNWSRNSFLAQPITYITDLFGIDNDNIVIYLLSYWLDISIIWLVFDLVMYVPLVIHRWIDKGVLE